MNVIARLALACALLLSPAAALAEDEGIYVPPTKPAEEKPAPRPKAPAAPPVPDGRAALVGIWKFDAKGGLKCGDGTIQFSQSSSGKLSGLADVGMTDATRDFREISVSGHTVTLTYGYFHFMNGDPRVKTLSGQLDESQTTIRGIQIGKDVEGCSFTMTKR